jgi:rfaE bifunctional protein kinase chain/domain
MIDLKNTFDAFNSKKIIIVGDVMIDTYLNGSVSRISPEAPVPIVQFKSKEHRLGGAANVALNIKALGATPFICSVIGDDEDGKLFHSLLSDSALSAQGIVVDAERMTTVKTRVIGNNQQLLRLDSERTNPILTATQHELIQRIQTIAVTEKVDAIIFEDYNKGVLTENVIRTLIDFANEHEIITTVDPKKENFFAYYNVTLFKPNLKELKEGVGLNFEMNDRTAFLDAVARF